MPSAEVPDVEISVPFDRVTVLLSPKIEMPIPLYPIVVIFAESDSVMLLLLPPLPPPMLIPVPCAPLEVLVICAEPESVI